MSLFKLLVVRLWLPIGPFIGVPRVRIKGGPTLLAIRAIHFPTSSPYIRKSPRLTPPDYAKRGSGSDVAFDPSAFSPSGGLL